MRRLAFIVPLAIAALVPALASAQSRCADCHYSRPDAPGQTHLMDWDRSDHARNSVGCERCHGGNPNTFEPLQAHRDMLHRTNLKSPVHRRNLPTTCGACHTGPFVAFQDSTHYQLLEKGDQRGPTCSTCHGEVAGRLLSPKGLEAACADCHGPKEVAPRAARARGAREMYESLRVVREEMKLAETFIKRVSDKAKRQAFVDRYEQARVPLVRAVNAGHKFVYDDLQSNLANAQKRVQELLAELANQRR